MVHKMVMTTLVMTLSCTDFDDLTADPPCGGPRHHRDSGRCYRFGEERYAWEAAEADCVAWGGHLVSIRDSREHAVVKRIVAQELATLPDGGTGDGVWIGLGDRATEGMWTWTTGEPFSFHDWASGEPDGKDAERDCVFQYGPYFRGTWDDFKCSVAAHYVCVR